MSNITYETGWDEPIHPDPTLARQMEEVGVSECKYGCKIYAHPSTPRVRVLGHNSQYGCRARRVEPHQKHAL